MYTLIFYLIFHDQFEYTLITAIIIKIKKKPLKHKNQEKNTQIIAMYTIKNCSTMTLNRVYNIIHIDLIFFMIRLNMQLLYTMITVLVIKIKEKPLKKKSLIKIKKKSIKS